jgi:hypothetical protein
MLLAAKAGSYGKLYDDSTDVGASSGGWKIVEYAYKITVLTGKMATLLSFFLASVVLLLFFALATNQESARACSRFAGVDVPTAPISGLMRRLNPACSGFWHRKRAGHSQAVTSCRQV